MEKRQKVCVTGITGFVGSWVCKYLLEDDIYDVRGTVRDKNNQQKLEPLKEEYGQHWDRLEIFEADLLDSDSLFAAVEGCKFVIHVASPVPLSEPNDENEVIAPAVEGTKTIVKACQNANVTRLIVTSSCSVIEDFTNEVSHEDSI